MGTPSITDPKARFVAKNGSFLEKEFFSKEVSGRKVELDEVTVPAPNAVVLTKLSLNTRLDRSSRDIIELNVC